MENGQQPENGGVKKPVESRGQRHNPKRPKDEKGTERPPKHDPLGMVPINIEEIEERRNSEEPASRAEWTARDAQRPEKPPDEPPEEDE